jgi:hypothetical protein
MQTSAKRSPARKDPAELTVQDPWGTGCHWGDGGARTANLNSARAEDTKMALLVECEHPSHHSAEHGLRSAHDPNATSKQDDEVAHRLYLVSISAKAMAKIEFLQQEWINNGNFMNLAEERDPNVDLQEGGATSRSPECRSGAASTASRLSTSSAVAVLLHVLPVRSEMARGPPLARRRSYRNEGRNDERHRSSGGAARPGTGKRCLDVGGKLRGMLEQEPVRMKRGPYRIRKSEESLGRRSTIAVLTQSLPREPANILALRYFGPWTPDSVGRAKHSMEALSACAC